MEMQNLANNVEIERPQNSAAAGTSDLASATPVDMQGFEGCLFILAVGALTATQETSLKVQQSDDSDGDPDDFSDLEGSDTGNLADGDGNKLLVVDVKRPTKRYLKPVVLRGTANAVVDGVIAIKYGPRKGPQTDLGALALARTVLAGPAEGTA